MQNKRLAQWLQDHTHMLNKSEQQHDNALHAALYEGLIDVSLNNDSRMVDSVVESAAAHAVATGRELTSLLNVHQNLRQRIWDRVGMEVDPEPAFAMLSSLDVIFVHVNRVTIDAYLNGMRLAQAAKSQEISRLYTDSEQQVMAYATEVSRANRELARLEQAKTDFISIAAHELKTPLTLIRGYATILNELELGENNHTLTSGIVRGAERMNNILEDMLDLSALDMRRVKLVIQQVSLRKVINLAHKQIERVLQDRNQTLQLENLEELPPVEGDEIRLFQIFRQLISNAIKFTPDGGCITISGQFDAAAGKVRLVFSDTGVGIAPEDQVKIFEKFFRTGNSSLHSTGQTKFMGAGPGLGLALVKGMVEAHGGHVTVDSPGFDMHNCPGSRFAVTLPVTIRPPQDIVIERLPG